MSVPLTFQDLLAAIREVGPLAENDFYLVAHPESIASRCIAEKWDFERFFNEITACEETGDKKMSETNE